MHAKVLGLSDSRSSRAAGRFLHWTSQHEHLAGALKAATLGSVPVVVLLGPAGVGKTILVRRVLEAGTPELAIGHLARAVGEVVGPGHVLAALGRSVSAPQADTAWRFLERRLAERHRAGTRTMLIIDSAERLTTRCFETLTRLAGLTWEGAPLMTQVLVGRPTLAVRLGEAKQQDFVSRRGVAFAFRPMSEIQTASYIRQWLEAKGQNPETFDRESLASIHARGRGLPGEINRIGDLCLSAAHGSGSPFSATTTIGRALASAKPEPRVPTPEQGGRLPFPTVEPSDFVAAMRDREAARLSPPRWRRALLWTGAQLAGLFAAKPPAAIRGTARARVANYRLEPRLPSAITALARLPAHRKTLPVRLSAPLWQAPAAIVATAAAGAVALMALSWEDGPPQPVAASAARPSTLVVAPAHPNPTASVPTEPPRAAPGGGASDAGPGLIGEMRVAALSPSKPARAEPAARQKAGSGLVRPGPAGTVSQAELAAPDPDAAGALFREGLGHAGTDPTTAALAFARAAARGHARAAYYLGQIYETGDGVPLDPVLARLWYERAGAVVGAQRRLAELPEPGARSTAVAPTPIFAARSGSGEVELVWTGPPGAEPAGYLVELSRHPGAGPHSAVVASASAVRLKAVEEGGLWWRVAPTGHETWSDWTPVPEPVPESRAGALQQPITSQMRSR